MGISNSNGVTKTKKILISSNSPPGTSFERFFKQLWWSIINAVTISVPDTIKNLFISAPVIEVENLPKRFNQVAIMTGEPRGIGFHIVKKLLQLDYTVILGVPNMMASEKGIDEIRKLGITSGRVKLLNLNLKSLDSVRKFAKDVLSSEEGFRIDLLMNNAGIINPTYEMTADNFESIFQVNYLSHFLLTNLLLPRIKETAAKKSSPCEIVNTSSHTHRGGNIDFDELETSKVFSPLKCYIDSKLCTVIHVKTLEKKFQEEGLNIHAYACHPGEIPMTGIWPAMGLFYRVLNHIMKYFCRTTDDAANSIMYPVLTPEVGEKCGGEYFENGKVKLANPQAYLLDVQNKLWNRSLELTQAGSCKKQE